MAGFLVNTLGSSTSLHVEGCGSEPALNTSGSSPDGSKMSELTMADHTSIALVNLAKQAQYCTHAIPSSPLWLDQPALMTAYSEEPD